MSCSAAFEGFDQFWRLKDNNDMGNIRKLSTWSSAKKSQKLEKSTFWNKFWDSAKLFNVFK